MVANSFDPEVPEKIYDLLDKIILKIEEIEHDNNLLEAGDVATSLLRGAKASARIELREAVCEDDIRRASVVQPFSLVGGDLREIVENPLTYTADDRNGTNVVVSGASGEIKELIIELESEYDEGVPIGKVVEKASEIGLNASRTKQEIDKLKNASEVSEPKQNRLLVKDKMEWLIKDIERDHDNGAPIEIVLERAPEIGLDASQAEREIEKLRRKGEVYEPKMDQLRTI
jgi:DNA replicative helicase MCM subunit Mcm2 (Cdc46/Mcm family)